ncbi:MAG: hypothetical protein GQ477_04330 [Nanohaloarchaea archaeon]|nr:hypothetical protein [Candidatus Nanohaloarchaea archaeon]
MILLIFTLMSTALADEERITNGGFETGDFTGWAVVAGSGGTVTIETSAPEGTYYAYIDSGLDSSSYFFQFINFTNVETLTFKYKSDADFYEGSAATDVYIGATKVASLYSTTWADKSINVSTYSGVQTLKFFVEMVGVPEGYAYMDIDIISAIRSNSVPEPTNQTNLGNNLVDYTPTITWTKGTEAEGDTVTTYVYVGTNSTPTEIEGCTTNETYDLGTNVTLTDGNTYYYRLRSYDGYEWSSYTTADEFRMNAVPTVPTSFTNLDTHLIDHTPTITWTKGTDSELDTVTTYVYVGTTSTPTTIEGSTTSETLNLGSTVTLTDGNTYYYRLRSYDGYGYSDYTIADEFRMNSLPSISNVILSPTPTTDTDDLTAHNDTTIDPESDSITLYYRWYKNSTLQPVLNDMVTVNQSNFTSGETWKVGIILNDGYENGIDRIVRDVCR